MLKQRPRYRAMKILNFIKALSSEKSLILAQRGCSKSSFETRYAHTTSYRVSSWAIITTFKKNMSSCARVETWSNIGYQLKLSHFLCLLPSGGNKSFSRLEKRNFPNRAWSQITWIWQSTESVELKFALLYVACVTVTILALSHIRVMQIKY